MADQAYKLIVRKGPRPGQVFTLQHTTVVVGRDPLSDIVIEDPEVSRRHARLTLAIDSYTLQDMGSTNGTFVDGKRLGGEPVLLESGQTVMFGSNVTVIFQVTQESDPMATMIAPPVKTEGEEAEAEEEVEEPAEAEEPAVPEPAVEVPAMPEVPVLADDLDELETPVEGLAEEALVKAELAVSEPEVAEPELAEPIETPEIVEAVEEEDEGLATMLDIPMGEGEPQRELEIPPEFEETPTPFPSFEEPGTRPPEPMPSYEAPPAEPLEELKAEPVVDSGGPLPEASPEPVASPPPQAPRAERARAKRSYTDRNVIIAGVVLVLLCCCMLLIVLALFFAFGEQFAFGLDAQWVELTAMASGLGF